MRRTRHCDNAKNNDADDYGCYCRLICHRATADPSRSRWE